jgi:hypothetical protein
MTFVFLVFVPSHLDSSHIQSWTFSIAKRHTREKVAFDLLREGNHWYIPRLIFDSSKYIEQMIFIKILMGLFSSSKRLHGKTSRGSMFRGSTTVAAPSSRPTRVYLLPLCTYGLEVSLRSNNSDISSSANPSSCSTLHIVFTACLAHPTTSSTTRPANPLRFKSLTSPNLCFQCIHRSTLNPSSPVHKHFPPSLPPTQYLHSTPPSYNSLLLQNSQIRGAAWCIHAAAAGI